MLRVLYSFPLRIGAQRVCYTAWNQVDGLLKAGANVSLFCGSVAKNFEQPLKIKTTLSKGNLRIPIRLLGRFQALQIHDRLTANWLEKNHHLVDLVHCWPSASLRTIQVAKKFNIPSFLERPNTHTRYALEQSQRESEIVSVPLPKNHDHAFDSRLIRHEEEEYSECDYLLCPSSFVAKTFQDFSFPQEKLLRHQYGFESSRFTPNSTSNNAGGLTAVYAGVCEPRKGLHYALKAWLQSDIHKTGRFQICGEFVPGYASKLEKMLDHPSIEVLGHRSDLPEILKSADIFILPSIEEGSALVTYEARGSGCVLVVSDASGAKCEHKLDALVHPKRSVEILTQHLNLLSGSREFLSRLRHNSLETRDTLTWEAAGKTLYQIFQNKVSSKTNN